MIESKETQGNFFDEKLFESRRNSNQKQLTHQYHQWFDGLKTLQFLKSDFE